MRKHVRWESVLDVSDYQEIVNIVYVGLLGIEKNISEDCNEQFYQEYKRSLLLYESYEKVEEVIKWQLERYNIEALFLLDSSGSEMYPKPEMAQIRQIEICHGLTGLCWIWTTSTERILPAAVFYTCGCRELGLCFTTRYPLRTG